MKRGKKVENVDFAGKARGELRGAGGGFEVDGGAGGRERVAGGAPVAVADSIGADFGAGVARGGGQFFGARIVRVDDGDARSGIDRAVEEQALGGEVVFHRLVVVEVVAREVGEDGDIEGNSGHAALIERVA